MLAEKQFHKSALSLSVPRWCSGKPYLQLCSLTLLSVCSYGFAQPVPTVMGPQQMLLPDGQPVQSSQVALKPLEFDDLEQLEIDGIDDAMVKQIYQVAEQAKAEAQVSMAQSLNEWVVQDATQQELVEINTAPVNVDALSQSIRADREIVVKANETGAYLPNTAVQVRPTPESEGVFKRLLNRVRPARDLNAAQVPRIRAVIQLQASARPEGLSDAAYSAALLNLENNLEAKLSSFTQEALQEFDTATAQLRSLSQQAAQAVGFYNASFSFERVANDPEQVLVKVQPNTPVLVNSQNIEFSGLGRMHSQFQLVRLLPELQVGDIFDHGLYELNKERINTAASNNGYFDGYWRLHDVRVALPQDQADIQLRYETGERYQLAKPEFKMSQPDQDFPLDRDVLEKMVPWQPGDDYTQWRVNGLANNLTNTRYFNFSLVEAVIPDPVEGEKELAPDIEALLQQHQLSATAVEPQPKTRIASNDQPQTVADESQFAGRDESTPETLTRDGQDSFNKLDQLKQRARDEKMVPVIVTLNADNLNSLEAGVGYGTDTGARLRAQYRRAIVNRRGHSFDANLELSEIRQSIDGRYNIPYLHPLHDYISVVGGYEREERNNVSETGGLIIESGVAGVDRIIKDPQKSWQHIFGLRYRLDRLTETGIQDNSIEKPEQFISNGEQESLLVGYELSRLYADPALNPKKGFRQLYKVELGTEKLLSDTDMAIVNAAWNAMYSVGNNANHQFVGRAHVGYIFSDSFKDVPYNLRYFAGGDQTLRGFDYKSLSPEEDGYKIGGQAMAVGSLEYNYQFKPGWRGAVFTDFGNAYNENFSNDTEYSVGLGVRWASPIGPLRIDVASGLSDDNHPIRVHFFIGPQL